jgi:uncharacterized protein (TIGR02678 family)
MPLTLPAVLAAERRSAVRALLARPFVVREADPDLFALVAAHGEWLTDRFDEWCGWPLRVDFNAGTVRLLKRRRAEDLDASRPARRGDGTPLDQQRYSLLMTVCAELVARPHATIGDIADAVEVVTRSDVALREFDVTSRAHRGALVDVLHWLVSGGYLVVRTGDLNSYAGQRLDAVLQADVRRLATLLSAAIAPSRVGVEDPADAVGWLAALTAEPRYGDPADRDDAQRVRWSRHQLLRAVLDDPAVDVVDLPDAARDYLRSITGRRVVADAVDDAGLALERHADVLVAVDAAREATDVTFGDRSSVVAQVAGTLLAALVDADRVLVAMSVERLTTVVADLLAGDPGWAKGYQEPGGARVLTALAIEQLEMFGLARRDGDRVVGRPAAGRYAVTVTDARRTGAATAAETPALFADEEPA